MDSTSVKQRRDVKYYHCFFGRPPRLSRRVEEAINEGGDLKRKQRGKSTRVDFWSSKKISSHLRRRVLDVLLRVLAEVHVGVLVVEGAVLWQDVLLIEAKNYYIVSNKTSPNRIGRLSHFVVPPEALSQLHVRDGVAPLGQSNVLHFLRKETEKLGGKQPSRRKPFIWGAE